MQTDGRAGRAWSIGATVSLALMMVIYLTAIGRQNSGEPGPSLAVQGRIAFFTLMVLVGACVGVVGALNLARGVRITALSVSVVVVIGLGSWAIVGGSLFGAPLFFVGVLLVVALIRTLA